MAYKDLGRKQKSGAGPCEAPNVTEKDVAPRINYPYFNLETAEAVGAKADSVIECKVKLRFKGFRKTDYDKERPYHNEFDVIAIDFGDADVELDEETPKDAGGLQAAIEEGLKKKAKKHEAEDK